MFYYDYYDHRISPDLSAKINAYNKRLAHNQYTLVNLADCVRKCVMKLCNDDFLTLVTHELRDISPLCLDSLADVRTRAAQASFAHNSIHSVVGMFIRQHKDR